MCKYGMDRSYGIYGQGNFVNSFRVPSFTLSMLLIFLAETRVWEMEDILISCSVLKTGSGHSLISLEY